MRRTPRKSQGGTPAAAQHIEGCHLNARKKSGNLSNQAVNALIFSWPVTPPVTTSPPGCTATVSLNSWNGGYVATVRVTAGSSAVNGWTVNVTLPSGGAVTGAWSATNTGTTGTVSFRNVDYNRQITAGGSTEFGFQGTGTGPGATPTCTAG
jgi:endo-1,4-beta-xylanase